MKATHAGGVVLWGLWLGATFGAGVSLATAAPRVTATTGELNLPTYGWAAVKHPYFPGTDGVNIYPYAMLDFLSREKTNRLYQTVVVENEFLRITFLPELGGKIYEVIDKTTAQSMFYVNHVVKPGLIGQCGAWTSGGVEWNTGPQGHTVSCLLPVEVRVLEPEPDGSRSVAIGETERIYGTHWTVVVTLRPGRSFIEERIRIYNPTETVRPYYFWNCTAVPNTPGFRFVYPMTLGMDHSGEKFFEWPIDHGKDLTRGASYQDASSIFAYQCDQDFFGSYNDDLDRGVVSFANHHQLPGKKAWTWGHGSYGTMHQADLTDNDGPYNEVQTGPLLTQGEVGRLDPCEAVEWQEWWYPIHALGGFTFANCDLAAKVTNNKTELALRLLGTGTWGDAQIGLRKEGRQIQTGTCRISPQQVSEIRLATGGAPEPFEVEVRASGQELARFRVPLELPVRKPPRKQLAPQTASEIAEAGWGHFLFARFKEAEAQFHRALTIEANNPVAQTGLAYLNLDRDPAAAASAARAALQVTPDDARARYALAVAETRLGDYPAALDDAWKATLDPATAIPARALVAKLLLRRRDYSRAIAALSEAGPWTADPLCRNRLALALFDESVRVDAHARSSKSVHAERVRAASLALQNLTLDPLDALARNIQARIGLAKPGPAFGYCRSAALELFADYLDLGEITLSPIDYDFATPRPQSKDTSPLLYYWTAYIQEQAASPSSNRAPCVAATAFLNSARQAPAGNVFPHRREMIPALQWALQTNPNDGRAALYLGDLFFHLGRTTEAREQWRRAAALGAEPVVAYRALGMAAKALDGNLSAAREWLEQAIKADASDAIVARDLANVLFALADQAQDDEQRRTLTVEARDRLQAAFTNGKGRSDFVALLARAYNRLGECAETARMLDTVRVTIWEGGHEVHDLFEQAHLALGDQRLAAGDAAGALAEFNRALEYPGNLATGKLEEARQAHINYRRGQALAALGRNRDARAAWKLAADEPESKDPKIEEARKKAQEALDAAGK